MGLETPVVELSLAVRQQIELVRVLSRDAAVLLLDEPTAALGAVQADWLFRQIRRVQERDGTVVFISHRMSEVRQICDRVTVLRNGQNVATFATPEVNDDHVVAMMLGHAVEHLQAVEHSVVSDAAAVVTVSVLSSEPALRSASFSLRQGEVLGLARRSPDPGGLSADVHALSSGSGGSREDAPGDEVGAQLVAPRGGQPASQSAACSARSGGTTWPPSNSR